MLLKKRISGLPGGAMDRNLPANIGGMGSIPGPGRIHMLWRQAPHLLTCTLGPVNQNDGARVS